MRNKFASSSLVLGIAIAGASQSAYAAALASESFLTGGIPSAGEYTAGAISGQNPTVDGFTGAWGGNSATQPTVSLTGLDYSDPNYLAPSGGSLVTGDARRFFRSFDTDLTSGFAGNGTVYMSILANFGGGLGAWNYAAFEVGSNNGADASKALAVGIDSSVAGNFMYQLNNGSKVSLGVTSNNATHLFLVRFDMSTTAASDSLTMWVDPDLSGGPGSDPSGGVSVTGLNLVAINNFRVGSGAGGNSFDEIRFGTTLADVGVIPEPGSALLGGLGLMALLRRRRQG